MITASGPWGTWSWTYDVVGNRLSDSSPALTNYQYNASTQRLTSTTGAVPETFTYDAVGRLTQDAMATYGYSAAGKLVSATASGVTASYTYDAAGERLSHTVNGATTFTLRGATGQTLSEYTSPCGVATWSRDLIYGAGRLIGALKTTAQNPTVAVNAATLTVGESAGTAAVGIKVTTANGAALACSVTASFHTTYGSAAAGPDYGQRSGIVTFGPGTASGTVQTVTIPIVSDTLDEDNETFQVDLTNATGGHVGSPNRTVVTITDDDPTPTLSITDVSQAEGNSGITNATFAVSLSAVSGRQVQVQYATANGTATWSDYGTTTGTLTIPAGSSSGFITVPIHGDLVPEANETFVVNLSGAVNATLADSQGIGTIVNDDTVVRRTWGDFYMPRDGRADAALFDPVSTGLWTFRNSDTLAVQTAGPWGAGGDIPVPADYDGDGTTDCAVFRPSVTIWYVLPACGNAGAPPAYGVQWGSAGDVPVPADYDGDGKTDIAVFRPSNRTWYILQSANGVTRTVEWGQIGNTIPVPGDYDGDGKADLTYYTISDGAWWILKSTTGTLLRTVWGVPGSSAIVPVPADYDGDGKTDLAYFYPSNVCWYIVPSSTGLGYAIAYGTPSMTPVPADYDGDGKVDLAQYDPSTRNIYMLESSSGISTGIAMADVSVAGVVPALKRPQ